MSQTKILTRKILLFPTEEQKNLLYFYFNSYRYVYNWALNKEQEQLKLYNEGKTEYKFLSWYDLGRLFTTFRNQPENDWLLKFPVDIARNALFDVVQAYNLYFAGYNGYPKFKSKKCKSSSCKIGNRKFYFNDNFVKIKGLKRGELMETGYHTNQYKIDNIHYHNPSIVFENGNYWLFYGEDVEIKDNISPKSEPIGIDLGITNAFTLSTGEVFNYDKKKVDRLNRSIKRQQRHCQKDINRLKEESKQTKTKFDDMTVSKRAIKRKDRLRKTISKKYNYINTFDNTVTKKIVDKNPQFIVMETLSVQEMTKRKHVAKGLNDNFLYSRRKKMEHKCELYNIPIKLAPRLYKSSQICNNCKSITNIHANKIYVCPVCGMIENRDINAAKNLVSLYTDMTVLN